MLETQKYLRTGRTPEDLRDMYDGKIDVFYHDTLPLVGFSYRQDAPKFETIVRECRGLVLLKDGSMVVAKPMTRFFNLGESEDDADAFDWNNFRGSEKVDGSMLLVYHYGGEWMVNTRGTFGNGLVGNSGKSWSELFWETSGIDRSKMQRSVTYVFEMWTPHNTVIRRYKTPRVWLLSVLDPFSGMDFDESVIEAEARWLNVRIPESYLFTSKQEVESWLKEREEIDPTFEGVVLRDRNNIRIKVKTSTYLALHRLMGNGNLYYPKSLVPLWLSADYEEVLLHFPDVEQPLYDVGSKCDMAREKLWELWRTVCDIEDQKTFAQMILPRTEFSAILFDVRKRHPEGLTREQFNDAWKQWDDLILKKLQWSNADACEQKTV